MYHEINVKSALNKLENNFPYGWDLNIYRGCPHNCQYCYALYSHDYLGSEDFFGDIFIKKNIIERLEKELRSKKWKHEKINIGGVTDSYQAIESKYGLMRQVLKLMIKYQNPITISTKSTLILRDLDLIDQLSQVASVSAAMTVTTVDEKIRELIEPKASPSYSRFETLKKLKQTNARVGMHVMPILPYITDSEENLKGLFFNAQQVGVDYALCGTLYLRGKTKPHFLNFIKNSFPHLYGKYLSLYTQSGAGRDYQRDLHKRISKIRKKYRIFGNSSEPKKQKLVKAEQSNLDSFRKA
ncbi:MAG: radical SAM protein [archaeon]